MKNSNIFRFYKFLYITILYFFCIAINAFSQTTSGLKYPEINITYPENWTINGNSIQITRTTIYGNTLFTVHCVVSFIPGNNVESINFAKDIARYAVENGYLKNALLYNDYSNDLHILDNAIGVGLVYKYNNNTQDEKGYAYNFNITDLFSSTPIQTNLPIPNGYTGSYPSELIIKLLTLFNSKNYSSMYSLYSENALKTLTHINDDKVFEFYKRINTYKSDLSRKTILVYLGNKANKNGYLLYLPILVSPEANIKESVPGYFQIMIADEDVGFGIYNVTVNITQQKDFAKFK